MDQPASPLAGGAQIRAGGDRLTAQIEAMLPDWTLAPAMAALQTMRGIALVNAATLVAELGDLSRFANPRQLMAYLGLVPSEHSSGASVKRGGLTKAGNSAARRLRIEAAWTYRFPARVSRELRLRQREQPRPIREIAWKAQLRLCAPAIASSLVAANRPMSSLPRSPVSWQASSGPSPGACRRRRAEHNKPVTTCREAPANHPTCCYPAGLGRGRGQENPRIHYLPDRRSDAGP
jgi:Transposase IS116/IS110/IS902 family